MLNLENIYQLFGFKQQKIPSADVHVFTQNGGYFFNADLIVDRETEQSEKIKRDLESAGYSVSVRNYKSSEDAERELFRGFFKVEESKKLLKDGYEENVGKNEKLIDGRYTYHPCRYFNYQTGESADLDLVGRLLEDVQEKGPKLIIVEAAAGYGKTSTIYEFVKSLVEKPELDDTIPFLAELYRNRQAKIFRYVLLDEINRQFSVKLECVEHYVKKGNVILIVDGFDELIQQKNTSKSEDDPLNEAMLETIASLLKDNAKIIITARKTAVFSEGPFSIWKQSHEGDFNICRYEIQEPNVEDWLSAQKIRYLNEHQIDLIKFPNPLLLGWLQSQEDSFFQAQMDSEQLLSVYFEKLLKREIDRQSLNASVEEQKNLLKSLAGYYMDFSLDCLSKSELEDYLNQFQNKFLVELLSRYSGEEKTSFEELVERICMHACLDRKNSGMVGFVNDFTFGFFLGEYIISGNADDKWDLFFPYLDKIFLAFSFRSDEIKKKLWVKLNELCELLNGNADETKWKYQIDKILKGKILRDYVSLTFDQVKFDRDVFGEEHVFEENSFFKCTFDQITFTENVIKKNTFLCCTFYNCEWPNSSSLSYANNFKNCKGIPEFPENNTGENGSEIVFTEEEIKVLKRFWPDGSNSPMKQKQMQSIKSGGNYNCDDAIESLRKKGFLTIKDELVTLVSSKIFDVWNGLKRE